MLLNVVAGDVDAPGFAERLARKGKRLRGLEQRGWVEETGDGTWILTDEGRAAKERLGAIVDGIRSRVAGAVSPEDFATTLASLEAIARELGWDENERMPWTASAAASAAGSDGASVAGSARLGPGFGHDIHHDFGPNLHKGFRPGLRPGSAARPRCPMTSTAATRSRDVTATTATTAATATTATATATATRPRRRARLRARLRRRLQPRREA